MDKQLESFLDTLNWKDIDNNVSQAVISHDDFCKYVFRYGEILVGDRVLIVECDGYVDGLNLTYTLTLH